MQFDKFHSRSEVKKEGLIHSIVSLNIAESEFEYKRTELSQSQCLILNKHINIMVQIDQQLLDLTRAISLMFNLPLPKLDQLSHSQLQIQLTLVNKIYAKKLIEFSQKINQLVKKDPLDYPSRLRDLFKLFKTKSAPTDNHQLIAKIFKYTRNLIQLQKQARQQSISDRNALKQAQQLLIKAQQKTQLNMKVKSDKKKQQELMTLCLQQKRIIDSLDNSNGIRSTEDHIDAILKLNNQRLSKVAKELTIKLQIINNNQVLRFKDSLEEHLNRLNNSTTIKDLNSLKKSANKIQQHLKAALTEADQSFPSLQQCFERQRQLIDDQRKKQKKEIGNFLSKIEFSISQLKTISVQNLRETIAKQVHSFRKQLQSHSLLSNQKDMQDFKRLIVSQLTAQNQKIKLECSKHVKQLKLAEEKLKDAQRKIKKLQDGFKQFQRNKDSKQKELQLAFLQLSQEKKNKKALDKQLKQSRCTVQQQRSLLKDLQVSQKQCQMLKQQLSVQSKQRKNLLQRIKGCEKRVQKQIRQKQEAQTKERKLQVETSSLKKLVQDYQRERLDCSKSLKDFRELTQRQQQMLKQLELSLQQSHNTNKQSFNENENLKDQRAQLNDQLSKYKQYTRLNEVDIQSLQNQLLNLSQVIKDLRERDIQRIQLFTQNKKLCQLNDHLMATVQQLEKDKNYFGNQLQLITQGAARGLHSHSDSYRSNYQKLKEQMSRITQILNERNKMQREYEEQIERYKQQLKKSKKSPKKI